MGDNTTVSLPNDIASQIDHSTLQCALTLRGCQKQCLLFGTMIAVVGMAWSCLRLLDGKAGVPSMGKQSVKQPRLDVFHDLSRSFPEWKDGPPFSWCVPSPPSFRDIGAPMNPAAGFFYVKIEKAASSTSGGIANRIAMEVGKRRNAAADREPCHVRMQHGVATGVSNNYGNRDRSRSFLWSVVREPTSRALSYVFFIDVTRNGMTPTDENVIRSMVRISGGYQLKYLTTRKVRGRLDASHTRTVVRDVLDDYDFIGTAERLDESAVILRLLLGLDAGDILYLNAKQSGGYDDGKSRRGCVKIAESFISPGVSRYLSSPEWTSAVLPDHLLYQAVNRSLDVTIEKLGRIRFEKALAEHRRLMKEVKEQCAATAVYPCSPEGVHQPKEAKKNCYWNDGGCGYPCIDRLLADRRHAGRNDHANVFVKK